MSNSSLVVYKKISPNRTTPRNHKIDTITIHCMAGDLSIESCGNLFAQSSRQASSNYGIGSDGRIGLYVEEKDRSWATSDRANDMRAVTIEVASGRTSPYKITDKAYDALIDLITDICKRNSIKKLVWSTNKSDRVNHKNGCNMTCHRDYANKACPGDYIYSREGKIADAVNKRLGSSTTTKTTTASSTSTSYSKAQFIKDVQKALGVSVTGKANTKTLNATVTVSKSKNSKHAVVKPIQKYLNSLSYSCGTADGVAGSKFDTAVKKYQKAQGCTSDGEITAKQKTWKKLLGLA